MCLGVCVCVCNTKQQWHETKRQIYLLSKAACKWKRKELKIEILFVFAVILLDPAPGLKQRKTNPPVAAVMETNTYNAFKAKYTLCLKWWEGVGFIISAKALQAALHTHFCHTGIFFLFLVGILPTISATIIADAGNEKLIISVLLKASVIERGNRYCTDQKQIRRANSELGYSDALRLITKIKKKHIL